MADAFDPWDTLVRGAANIPAPGIAATTTASSAAPQALTIESLMATVEKFERMDREWEREFNAVAIKHGFDLDAGDTMIVPKGFDMSLVPPRYRKAAVRTSLLVDQAMFLRTREESPQPTRLPLVRTDWLA